MLLSAAPFLSVGANPAVSALMDYKNYRTVVTSETISVDGELDEVYKNSQKISSESWIVGNSSKVSFDAYTALTLRGLYVFAEIKDGSLDKSDATSVTASDRFQIYIKFNDGTDLAWGWYEADYNGKVEEHSIMLGKIQIGVGDRSVHLGLLRGQQIKGIGRGTRHGKIILSFGGGTSEQRRRACQQRHTEQRDEDTLGIRFHGRFLSLHVMW